MTAYANILIPLPLSHPIFTYKIKGELEELWDNLVGKMVVVPFGKGKTYTGLILSISSQVKSDKPIRYKYVERVLPYPPIPKEIIELWKWAAHYYMCSLGDIFVAAVPSAIRPDGKQNQALRKPARTITGWVPSEHFLNSEAWQASLFVEMKRKPAVTKAMNQLAQEFDPLNQNPMSLADLAKWLDVSAGVVRQLKEHHIIEEKTIRLADPTPTLSVRGTTEDSLSKRIRYGSQQILLLHVENSSAEERIPFGYIKSVLEEDKKQVLLLFPTLDLLELLLPQLKGLFGSAIKCYYSETTDKEREESWLGALEGNAGVYVGLRAAAWLPFSNLGVSIVMDEEDKGYRQYEPAPRFTATNLAIMLSHFSKARSLLISATPSIESYMNAIQKKYVYASVSHENRPIDIQTISMPKAFERQRVQGRMLSFELMGAIREAIEEQGVALLLYQRKGFAKRATCSACGESPRCPKCHTIYRYFQESKKLVCGVCGHYEPLPSLCPECHKPNLVLEGTGIERVRSALERLYKGVNICMDHEIKNATESPQIILSTSYDPPHTLLRQATTIGILQLDLLTTFPDFRANEQAFHFLVKCRDEATKLKRMVIQYFIEKQNALTAFLENDYRLLLDHELEERHTVLFPPFSRHIDLYFESSAQQEAYNAALQTQNILTQKLKDCSIMGPAPLPIHKKDQEIGYKLSLLTPLNHSTKELREVLHDTIGHIITNYRGPQLHIYGDVDPL